MDYKNYLKIDDNQYRHIESNIAEYKRFHTNENVMPKITVSVPNGNTYTTPELISSPEIMLKNGLDTIQKHIDVGDDFIPQIRVEFGTGQVSHAFGCGMYIPEESPVCAHGTVLDDITDIDTLQIPSLDAGWFKKYYEFTKFYMDNKPDIVGIQLPDLQSPFNNAHLIRGNDILYDFYDDPQRVDLLLQKVTQYQVELTNHYRKLTNMEDGYFYDWGALWKGSARLSNCSLHMISTQFYNDFIKKHDMKYLNDIGGGRIHYCGEHDDGLMESFFGIPNMYGIDYDGNYHNLWDLSQFAPNRVSILEYGGVGHIDRLLSGDWGAYNKKNIIVTASARTVEEGRELYKRLKESYRVLI